MNSPSRDPSVEFEPHLREAAASDPSETRAERLLRAEASRGDPDDVVDHTVWEEPTLSTELAGPAADDQVTYSRWLERKIADTSPTKSWLTTLAIVLVAGPWGVIGAIGSGGGASNLSLVLVTIVGPVTEEITKIAAALWVVEKKPYLFKSLWQIFFCAAAGGAAFAFIENLLYLNVYIPHPSAALTTWRWTVCVAMHVNCSFIAGVGLARIWDNAIRNRHRPQLGLGVPWFVLAMAGHGMYNGLAVLAERMGWLEF
jgi:hypothetical protein